MKPKYNYDKLKGRIREYCKTNEVFSKELGISLTTLYNKLSGQVYFTQSEIDKAIMILNIEAEEIKPIFFTIEVE